MHRLVGQRLSLSQADRAISSDNCVGPFSAGEKTLVGFAALSTAV